VDVFIEKFNGEFRNTCTYAAYFGFDTLGCEIKFFQEVLMCDAEITKETPVVGSIQCVKKALRQVGASSPEPIDYPYCLTPFLKRSVYSMSFGEVRKQNVKCFVKPKEDQKRFTGKVFETYINTESLDDSFPVWVSDLIEFEVEYRCYIHNHELMGVHYYKGNFEKYINVSVVKNAIDIYKQNGAPIAYSLDFGVVKGDTVLVEVNDSFALGNYGLSPIKYAKMIADRWKQMCGIL